MIKVSRRDMLSGSVVAAFPMAALHSSPGTTSNFSTLRQGFPSGPEHDVSK